MAPVIVAVVEEENKIVVFGVNDTTESIQAQLRFGIFLLDGKYLKDESRDVELPSNASTRLAALPADTWTSRSDSMPFAQLTRDGQLLARGRTFSPLFKEIKWPAATVRVKTQNDLAIFQSDTFDWNVCLDLDGEDPLADNFFDVFPGIPYAIAWNKPALPRILHVGNDLPKLERALKMI